MLPAGNSRAAYETLCPSRAGNSTLPAFNALKAGSGAPCVRTRKPVNVKKFASTVTFGGTIKSDRMLGSLAMVVFTMVSTKMISERNLRVL